MTTTISERLVALRKELSLTQSEFAKTINRTQGTYSAYEVGSSKVPDRTIADICREHNVNEKWLREGTGEMFRPQKSLDNIIAENAGNLIKSDCIEAKVLMAELGSMSEEELKHVYNFMTNVAKKIAAELEQQQKEQNK